MLHQQAAYELGGNPLGGAAEEGVGEGLEEGLWEVLGVGDVYGGGCMKICGGVLATT